MNETFKKLESKKIVLSEGFYLEPDQFKGLVLVAHENAKRVKKDGSEEDIVKEQRYFYPNISKTLSKYLELEVMSAKSVEEIRDAILRVEKKIDSIKESW